MVTTDDVVRVLLVDDEPDVRFVLRRLFGSVSGWEVIGEAGDGVEAVERVAQLQPDVVVLDLSMPRRSGTDALPDIVERAPEAMVVVLSASDVDRRCAELHALGAFASYDKVSLFELPDLLREDLARFRVPR